MLNPQQTAIANFLLKYLDAKGGKSSKDDYPEKLQGQNFEHWDCDYVTTFLIDQAGLIDYLNESKYYITLTTDGYHAAKIGLNEYFKELDQDKELDREAKISSIDGVRSAKLFSKNSLALSMIAILLSAFAIWQNLPNNKTIEQGVYNTRNGKSGGNTTNIDYTLDSITIEKFKHSLKHDSVFLNEIKQLIILSDPKSNLTRSK